MSKINKTYALILTLIAVTSCLIVEAKLTSAQIPPKPPTPQFSIDTTKHTEQKPEQVSTNQYTGAKTTTPAYTRTNLTLTVTITNSPLATAYVLEIKGHYGSSWSRPTMNDPMSNGVLNITALASTGTQTVITLSGIDGIGYSDHWGITIPPNGEIDVRLAAINGQTGDRVFGGTTYGGTSSDWSPIQTITFPSNTTTTLPTSISTPSPTAPELSWLVIVPMLLSLLSVAWVVKRQKSSKKQ